MATQAGPIFPNAECTNHFSIYRRYIGGCALLRPIFQGILLLCVRLKGIGICRLYDPMENIPYRFFILREGFSYSYSTHKILFTISGGTVINPASNIP